MEILSSSSSSSLIHSKFPLKKRFANSPRPKLQFWPVFYYRIDVQQSLFHIFFFLWEKFKPTRWKESSEVENVDTYTSVFFQTASNWTKVPPLLFLFLKNKNKIDKFLFKKLLLILERTNKERIDYFISWLTSSAVNNKTDAIHIHITFHNMAVVSISPHPLLKISSDEEAVPRTPFAILNSFNVALPPHILLIS